MSPRFVYCTLVDRCLSISLHHSTTPSTHTLPLVNQYPAQHNRLKKIANQYWMTWRLYRSSVLNVSIYVPCLRPLYDNAVCGNDVDPLAKQCKQETKRTTSCRVKWQEPFCVATILDVGYWPMKWTLKCRFKWNFRIIEATKAYEAAAACGPFM